MPQAYEAQFLGNLLGTLLDTAAPIALRLLRERVRSMGAAAADDTAVAQEVNQFQTQFLGFLTPFIPIAVDLIGRIVQGATRGQAAGGPDAQSANSGGAAQADSQRAQSSYVR